jgi:hypothetical protein
MKSTIRPSIVGRQFLQKNGPLMFYAVQTPGAPTLDVFNRNTKRLQKQRAAQDVESSRRVDYLKDEVAVRLCERLLVSCHFLEDIANQLSRISNAISLESWMLEQMLVTLLEL